MLAAEMAAEPVLVRIVVKAECGSRVDFILTNQKQSK